MKQKRQRLPPRRGKRLEGTVGNINKKISHLRGWNKFLPGQDSSPLFRARAESNVNRYPIEGRNEKEDGGIINSKGMLHSFKTISNIVHRWDDVTMAGN